MGRTTRFLVLIVIAVIVAQLHVGPAAAGELVASEPATGTTVARLDRVVLRFSEPVDPAVSHVWLEQGTRVLPLATGAHLDDDTRTLVATVPELDAGGYRVGFHVIGADQLPLAGTLDVVVDPKAAPAPADLGGPTHLVRLLLGASLVALLGGLVLVAIASPRRAARPATRRLLGAAVVTAAVASFGLLAVQHAEASGLSVTQAMTPSHLFGALRYPFGQAALARFVLLAAAAALTYHLSRVGRAAARSIAWCGATAAVGLGLSVLVLQPPA